MAKEKMNYTDEEIQRALQLLEKTRQQRAKQRERLKNDPEAQEKRRLYARRQQIKNKLLLRKAKEAGITVSNEEIEMEMKGK